MLRTAPPILLALLLAGCEGAGDPPPSSSPPAPDARQTSGAGASLRVTVHWDDTRQTLRGFGASDAWSIQHVGTWPDSAREAIADLLFSTALDEGGRPRGIGLSIWRFNIGGGSAEQGEASGIRDPWRRAGGFLTDDGSYDWSRQAGQRWFLRAARARGVGTVIGFVNSPPVQLTRNGRAWSQAGDSANLAPERYDDFARFLATVARHFEDEGLAFDALSPVNEPQVDWMRGNNQEGSPWRNDEIVGFARVLDRHLTEAGLTTAVELPEANRIVYLYQDGTNRPRRDAQVRELFAEARLQDLPHVAPVLAAHGYGTTWPVDSMIESRKALRDTMRAATPEIAYAMSEYCILADNEEMRGPGRDLGMDPALWVARLVHFDLTLADATTWQWWLAVSPYDYKDGLVYVDKAEEGGGFTDSRLLWALGNYSRFLRPGAVRVGVTRGDAATELDQAYAVMVSAYRAADGRGPVVVAVNYGTSEASLDVVTEGGPPVRGWLPYVTSATRRLEPGEVVPAGAAAAIPARSVVTLVRAPS